MPEATRDRPPPAEPGPEPNAVPEKFPVRDRPGWPNGRWLALMLLGLALAALAWTADRTLTSHLATEAFREKVRLVLGIPVAAGGYICILAILGAFPNYKRLWVGFLAPVLLSTTITHVIKFLVGRARPDQGLGPFSFHPCNWLGEYQSFPSGHASAAATLALLLGMYFPRFRWVFYFYGTWIGFERIIYRRHYTSDVLAGFVIGALAVYLCVRWLGRNWYVKQRPESQSFEA